MNGKASDICPKCKNCKGMTRESNGVHDWLTEVECEDPYDGMVKTLTADSDVCCSMFEIRSEKKEPCDRIPLLQHELEMDKLRSKIHQLEKEKAAHMKGIERLKKSQEKLQNQVKNLQTTNEESYKREEKLENKVHKLERRLLEESKRFASLDSEFLIPIAHVLYPREAKICKPYSEVITDIKELKKDYERIREQVLCPIFDILYPDYPNHDDINVIDLLNTIKDFKVYADENGRMYKEIQEWREKCIARGIEIDHLLSENKELKGRIKYWSNIAINSADAIFEKNTKLNQTISDQEITIKALLITIKEMCKGDETNA